MAHLDPLRNIWTSIKTRCNHPWHKDYKHYGARGIKMDFTWQMSYSAFREWAEKNGYQPGLQIDRINNDGNYEPDNCHWVTGKKNSNNRRTCAYISVNGQSMSVTEACEKYEIDKWKVFGAVKRGLTHQEAFDAVRSYRDVKKLLELDTLKPLGGQHD